VSIVVPTLGSTLDNPTPLATALQMIEGPYADLVRDLSSFALADIMVAATREIEDRTNRRLAPFTLTETIRAEGIDPDELGADGSGIPLDLPGTLGRSYANSLGGGDLVRHFWLTHFASRYPDLWGPYTITQLQIVRSVGGTQNVAPTSIQGPDPDSGHVWLQIGTYLPVGSLLRVTYTGGYGTVPFSLTRACMHVAADMYLGELEPGMRPDLDLTGRIDAALKPWMR
jgi:hypothetical protein